ncbi:bifunctional nuclease family protein [Candidatus Acetothermia bacterium]|nr:bifunctional nuclease family protein [Candidatus Acetothermia bacterium]MBI3644242.1 bifunctional nuclease family protein [Candidatus Acetothermia bacterium]
MREVEVKALLVDPYQNTPVVLLKDFNSDKVVPVWIGNAEATAIAIALQEKEFPRPLTHDLLQTMVQTLGGELDMVVIDNIQDATYYATIFLRDPNGNVFEVDARPSDSIAIALRMSTPIYISEEVFANSAVDMPDTTGDEQDREKFRVFVENDMNLINFKKYIGNSPANPNETS